MKAMEWREAEALTRIHGEGFFVYDEAAFERNFRGLEAAFNRHYAPTRLAYSYKTNYTPDIGRLVDRLGGYAEVVSEMEYGLARAIGVDGSRIVYNGPCKSPASLRRALPEGATVNLDSSRDLEGVLAVARSAAGRTFGVAIRCNFPLDGKLDSRFGFDVEGEEFREAVAALRRAPNVRLAGLHCHFPNRDLASYAIRAERMIGLAQELFAAPPDFLNLGGGYYGTLPRELRERCTVSPPSFDDYARVVAGAIAAAFPEPDRRPLLLIEPGTALVADTFEFVTRVLSTKTVRGRRIATVAASIFNISPNTRSVNLPVRVLRRTAVESTGADCAPVDVAGFTCIESDYLTRGLGGPIAAGDFLVYSNVGSYSIVMKPPFILPNAPILKRCQGSGELVVIKQRESYEYIFRNFGGVQWT